MDDRGDWNHCTVSGRLLAPPVSTATAQGAIQAMFWLECWKGLAGQVVITQVPCVAQGETAAAVGALLPGAQVTVTGVLVQRPEGGLMVHVATIGG